MTTYRRRLDRLEAARLADARGLTDWFQRAIVADRDPWTLTLDDVSPIANALFAADPGLLGRLIYAYRAEGISNTLLDTWPDGAADVSAEP
jgi:hypothetical protein